MVEAGDVRARKRDRTREEILAAAWELARRDGVAGLALRDLAAAVGMQAPSLYTYFRSKNDLYDAMFAQAMAVFGERMEAAPRGRDAREALRNRARAFTRAAMEDPVRYELLFQRPIPGFAPSAASLSAGLASLEQTRDIARAAGLTDDRAFDLFMGTTRGLVEMQISNDAGGTRWTRLVDDAVDALVSHYTRGTPRTTRRARG